MRRPTEDLELSHIWNWFRDSVSDSASCWIVFGGGIGGNLEAEALADVDEVGGGGVGFEGVQVDEGGP